MPFINDAALDATLQFIIDECDGLYICSQEPTTYAEATSTYALGSKASPSIGAPDDGDVSGREITVAEITDGSATATGDATHIALTDSTNSRLLVADALDSTVGVTSGGTFTLTAFSITLPDPA